MNDSYVKAWISKALEDMRVAEHEVELGKNEMVTDAVCFHSQQAVEKLLKAFLISHNIEFSRTHDVVYLLTLCSEAEPQFSEIELGDMNYYAVRARYPDDDSSAISAEEALNALKTALMVKKLVLSKLCDF